MSEMPYGELARKDFIGFTVVSGTPFPLKGSDEAVQEQTVWKFFQGDPNLPGIAHAGEILLGPQSIRLRRDPVL